MLINRTEKNNIIEAIYDSSNIIASTYNKTTKTLSLVFKRGDEYLYEGVGITDYHKLELSESQGKIFHKYIKQYPFNKLGVVDINELKTRIESAKREELESLDVAIVRLARMIVEDYETNNKVSDTNIKDMIRIFTTKQEKITSSNEK